MLELRGKGIRVEVAGFEFSMSRHLALKSSGFINLDAIANSTEPTDNDEIAPDFEVSPEESISITPDYITYKFGRRGIDSSTRTVEITRGRNNTRMKPNYSYGIQDGDKFKIVPDRVKAVASYFMNGNARIQTLARYE